MQEKYHVHNVNELNIMKITFYDLRDFNANIIEYFYNKMAYGK